MKVLITRPQGGAFFFFITKGFINAFKDSGIEAQYWDGNEASFNHYAPDLYIGCSGHRQNVPVSFKGKVAIHVNPYGDKLEPINGVNINEQENAIRWVESKKPDIVFGYGLTEEGRTFWKNWSAPFVGVPTAGDATLYYPSSQQKNNIVFLGGRWPYKAHNIDKWLLPVIKKAGKNIIISGWGGWNGFEQYIGPLPNEDSGRKLLASALVGPCICEPHTSKYGIDIPERFFKVALCGALPVLDKIHGFDRYCNNYVMANDPKQYCKLILNYACNKDYIEEGQKKAKIIRNEVLNKHTYHHRMANLLKSLGYINESNQIIDRINVIRQSQT